VVSRSQQVPRLPRDHDYFRFVVGIVSPPARGMPATYGVFTQSDAAIT